MLRQYLQLTTVSSHFRGTARLVLVNTHPQGSYSTKLDEMFLVRLKHTHGNCWQPEIWVSPPGPKTTAPATLASPGRGIPYRHYGTLSQERQDVRGPVKYLSPPFHSPPLSPTSLSPRPQSGSAALPLRERERVGSIGGITQSTPTPPAWGGTSRVDRSWGLRLLTAGGREGYGSPGGGTPGSWTEQPQTVARDTVSISSADFVIPRAGTPPPNPEPSLPTSPTMLSHSTPPRPSEDSRDLEGHETSSSDVGANPFTDDSNQRGLGWLVSKNKYASKDAPKSGTVNPTDLYADDGLDIVSNPRLEPPSRHATFSYRDPDPPWRSGKPPVSLTTYGVPPLCPRATGYRMYFLTDNLSKLQPTSNQPVSRRSLSRSRALYLPPSPPPPPAPPSRSPSRSPSPVSVLSSPHLAAAIQTTTQLSVENVRLLDHLPQRTNGHHSYRLKSASRILGIFLAWPGRPSG